MPNAIKKLFARVAARLSSAEPAESANASDAVYLDKLTFREEECRSPFGFFVRNFRVVALIVGVLTVVGTYAYTQTPRELSPEVKIAMAVVSTAYPGASPSDVEELVTKKLETKISSITGIKEMSSSSMSSFSVIMVTFDNGVDIDDAMRKLTDKVNQAQTDLPTEANDSTVKEISMSDRSIVTFALSGSLDPYVLRQIGDDLVDELEQLPDVREVKISGGEQREFEIAYDPAKLNHFGVSLDAANSMVKAANVAYPAGNFEGDRFTYPVRTDGRFWTAAELAELPVAHGDDGSVIYLKDLAKVSERATDSDIYSRASLSGSAARPAVTIEIIKRTGGNIMTVVKNARAVVAAKAVATPGLTYDVTADESKNIGEQFDQLLHDFIMTIILVFAVLFLIIGVKEAFVAGLAVPLVLFATFGVMLWQGLSLNFLSTFALLLALGLLVDDAIVVVAATKTYIRTGRFTPEQAVLLVLRDFKVVLTTTTLTTVWAFMPLLLTTGLVGSYIRTIPVTVSTTLIVSLLVALCVTNPLAAVLERLRLTRTAFWAVYAALLAGAGLCLMLGSWAGALGAVLCAAPLVAMLRWYFRGGQASLRRNAGLMAAERHDDELIKTKLKDANRADHTLSGRFLRGLVRLEAALPWYERVLRRLTATKRSRRLTVGLAAGLLFLAVLMPALGIVRMEFFPNSDSETLYVNYRGPTGLKLDETDKVARKFENQLRQYKEIENFQTFVGSHRSATSLTITGDSPEIFAVVVTLVPEEDRSLSSFAFADKIRADLAQFAKDGTLTVESKAMGPPSGAAFAAQISGDDLSTLSDLATQLKPVVLSIPGVVSAESSMRAAPAEYTFSLDPVLLERNSLTSSYVGSIMRAAISGVEVTKVMRDEDQITVTARVDKSVLPDLKAVQDLEILNTKKQVVSLKDVAKIELRPAVSTITRVDQRRTVTLSANIDSTTTSNAVVAEFSKRLAARGGLPEGYRITYGGENKTMEEAMQSIFKAMFVAFALIIVTLVVQFNSFTQAGIVLAAIPLSLIGVFFGLAVSGIDLSFPGLIGVLALFGIVVKNSIILVDKINLNLKNGIPLQDALVDAGKSRFEAIFITSICTILGILPITLSNPLWQGLGSTVIFGLSVSSFLTLFIVPTLYAMFFGRDSQE